MSVDLLLSPTIYQNSSAGIQSCKIGASDRNQSSKIQPTHELDSSDEGNFLSILKNVSPDGTATKPPHDALNSQSCDLTAPVTGNGNDAAVSRLTAPIDTASYEDGDVELAPFVSDWMALIKILENLGQNDVLNGSDLQYMADLNSAEDNQLTVLKALIARLQQHQQVPTDELKAGLQRLEHFIVKALETKVLMPLDQKSGDGTSPNPVANLSLIHQQLKQLIFGLQEPKTNSGWHMGSGILRATLPETVPADIGGGAGTAGRSVDINSGMSGTGSTTSPIDTRPFVSVNQQDLPAAHAVEHADAEPSKVKEKLGFLPDSVILNRTEITERMASAPAQNQQTGNWKPSDNQPLQSSASSGTNPVAVKVPEGQTQSIAGGESFSKIFQENQLTKEGVVEVEAGKNEETAGKVIKTEAGANDNSLLNSPGPSTIKSAETASFPKEIEGGLNQLRDTTVGQIVRKAAMHLKNGQHEARIELKPEFLGHIRMQVIFENQQVTVKILAQHGFVKDMIESNAHQLKADLQQQGLEVDKLEVSVSRDSEDSGNSKEKFTQLRTKHGPANHKNEERPTEDQQKDTGRPRRLADGAMTVDYFA